MIAAIVMAEEPYPKTVIIVAVKDSLTKKTPTVVQSVEGVVTGKREFPSANVLIARGLETPNKRFLLGLREQDARDA